MSDVWTVERHPEARSDRDRALVRRFVEIVELDDEFAHWIAAAYEQVRCGGRFRR